MPVRFYVDADLIGLGKLLVQARPDVTFAGDPGGPGIDRRPRAPAPVQPGVLDPDWIPIIASQGWIVITKDRHMATRPAEIDLIRQSSARHLRLEASPGEKLRKWNQLEIVAGQWRAIERLLDVPGPWIFKATRTGVKQEV